MNPKNAGKPYKVNFDVPDPDDPRIAHAEVGGKATWTWRSGKYPTFEIRFEGANPEDGKPGRSFSGSKTSPVVVKLNNEGHFHYKIAYTGTEAPEVLSSCHFCLGVVKEGMFPFSCKLCPPFGQSGESGGGDT